MVVIATPTPFRTGLPAESSNRTVAPTIAGSPASNLPLLFRSFHTRLPSDRTGTNPKSTVSSLSVSAVASAMPGVVFPPVSFAVAVPFTSVTVAAITPPVGSAPLMVPLSALSPARTTIGSFGPVVEPLPPPVLLVNPSNLPPAWKFVLSMLTLYWPGFKPVNR